MRRAFLEDPDWDVSHSRIPRLVQPYPFFAVLVLILGTLFGVVMLGAALLPH